MSVPPGPGVPPGPADIRVRAAVPGDLPALLALEEAAFESDRLDRRALRHAIASPTILALVADGEAVLVGTTLVQVRRGSRAGRLTSLAVAPDAAGRGVGRALLAAAEAAAAARGCDRLGLEVRADNARALALYERAGYERAGILEDYYEDGVAAIVLRKPLAATA